MYSNHTVIKLNTIAHQYKSFIHKSINDVLVSIQNTGAGASNLIVEVVDGDTNKAPQIIITIDDYLIYLDKRKLQWTKLPAIKELLKWAQTKTSDEKKAKRLAWGTAWSKLKYDKWKPKPWRKKSLSAVLKEMNQLILKAYDQAIEEDLQQAVKQKIAMAELVIKLVNGELAGKTAQSIAKEVSAAALAAKKAEVGTQAWVDANKKLEGVKQLQKDLKNQIEATATASDALKNAWNKLPGAQYFNQVTSSFKLMKTGVGGLVSQFGILKTAIAATGIGLLVILVTSLVTWFTKTERGGDALAKIMAVIGAAVNVLMDRMSKLIDSLIAFASGNWSEAADKFGEATKGVTKEIIEEAEAAARLADALDQLEELEGKLILIRSRSIEQISELRKQAKDENLTLNQRTAAIEKAIKIQKTLTQAELEAKQGRVLQALQVKDLDELTKRYGVTLDELRNKGENVLSVDNLGLGESTQEDLNKAFQSIADYNDELSKGNDEERALLTELNKLKRKERKEDTTDLKATLKEQADAYNAWLKEREAAWNEYYANQKSLSEMNIQAMADGRDKDMASLKLSLQQQIEALDTNAPYYAERLAATQELARQKVHEINAKWDKEDLAAKTSAIDLSTSTELNALNKKHLDGVVSQENYVLQSQQIAIDAETEKLALIRAAYGEQSKEYQDEYGKLLALQIAANDTFAKNQDDLTKKLAQSISGTLDVFAGLFGSLSGLFEQGTEEYKAFATAQAIISTIQGAVNAYTSALAIPYVGEILAPIAAGAALAAGYAQVRKIQKTEVKSPVKAETGGLLVGKRHTEGGINVNAEDGEFIFSRTAVKNIGVNNLSNMNLKYGRRMEAGGPVNPFPSRGPIASQAATSSATAGDDRLLRLENAFSNYAAKVDTWATSLQVKNVAYTNDRKGYQDQLDVLNKIKESADV